MKNKIDLIRKLQALAERGFGGEAENAAQMLKDMCLKFDIDINHIEQDDLIEREFSTHSIEHRKFVAQVISSIVGDRKTYHYVKMRNSPIIVSLTESEHLEAKFKLDFFWEDYKRQQEIFYRAYIQKQHLYKKDSALKIGSVPELTEKEKQDIKDMLLMLNGIKERYAYLQIEG